MKLKTFTIEDIRSWDPCYDPGIYLPEDWSGTALDLLKMDKIPVEDQFWVVLRKEVIDEKTVRLFAVSCARQVQHLMEDPRSIYAIDIAEKFALGEASRDELAAASEAALRASLAAWMAWTAACDADRVALRAAWAACDAARAAILTAREAAWAVRAAGEAAWAAGGTDRETVRAAAKASRAAQKDQFIKMLEAGEI